MWIFHCCVLLVDNYFKNYLCSMIVRLKSNAHKFQFSLGPAWVPNLATLYFYFHFKGVKNKHTFNCCVLCQVLVKLNQARVFSIIRYHTHILKRKPFVFFDSKSMFWHVLTEVLHAPQSDNLKLFYSCKKIALCDYLNLTFSEEENKVRRGLHYCS